MAPAVALPHVSLFNTLTRRVEPLVPLARPRVTLSSCGRTVWNFAHIGNFRTFLFEDLLRRWLEYSGYDVFQIMNLTDVDDRTIKAARQAGKSLVAHTAPFTKAFFEDRDYLRIKPAHVYTEATTYMPQMIALVAKLLEKGVAYKGEDGSVYFALAKFPAYGRLARVERRIRERRSLGLRALEKSGRRRRSGRRRLGRAVRPRAAGVASRVLRDVARGDSEMLRRANARHPLRRHRSDLPAPRERDRPVGRRDGPAVRASLGARGVLERARHKDVETAREFSHGAGSQGAGCRRRGDPVAVSTSL